MGFDRYFYESLMYTASGQKDGKSIHDKTVLLDGSFIIAQTSNALGIWVIRY